MKTVYPGHTRAGSALTELFRETFRLRVALTDTGDRISRPLGLTAARWQVLSYVARALQPAPVAHMARDMGLTRQSVQRLTDQLVTEKLLDYRANPNHRRAPLVIMTARGKKTFEVLKSRQVLWVNSLSRNVKIQDIMIAIQVMRNIEDRLRNKGSKTHLQSKQGQRRSRTPERT